MSKKIFGKQTKKPSAISRRVRFLKYVIENDNFDIRYFEQIIKENPEIRTRFQEVLDDYPPFAELQQDVYSSLYKYRPALQSIEKVDSDYVMNRQIMEMLMESDQYRELRLITKFDTVNSTVGTEVLSEEIKNILDELKDQMEEMMEQMKQAQQAMIDAQAQSQSEGEEGEGEGEGQQALTVKQVQEIMAETKKKLQDEFRQNEDVQSKMYEAFEKALTRTKEVSDLIHQWGLGSDGGFSRAPYQEKIKMIDRLKESKKLRELSTLAGRFKKIATRKKKLKVKKINTDIQDVVFGNDLARIVSSEAALLKDPLAKIAFYKKYADEELVQYQYGGKYSLGRGPIVACIDTSGSMHGQPEVFSKAVALGILDIARDQKRDFYVMHFDSRPADTIHTNTFLYKEPFSVDEVIDMAEYFGGGGTDFEEPLILAKQKIDEDKDFEKADIIFITDGQSAVGESFQKEFHQWKTDRGVQVYSVLINESYSSDSALQLFSDTIVPLNTMAKKGEDGHTDDVAEGIFDSLR
jgi:uncharacterized protein with von Willebrand factor type A (vWA) domain